MVEVVGEGTDAAGGLHAGGAGRACFGGQARAGRGCRRQEGPQGGLQAFAVGVQLLPLPAP